MNLQTSQYRYLRPVPLGETASTFGRALRNTASVYKAHIHSAPTAQFATELSNQWLDDCRHAI